MRGLLSHARGASFTLLFAAGSVAPFQCASEPPANRVREETPGEALYALADDFGRAGDRDAQIRTLAFIVQRYPRSHYAEDAKVTLGELGLSAEEIEKITAPPPPPASASASASAKP
ncbi:MAG: hypothetical protein U0271_47150 [Polyangiaceae bacterium]